MFSARIILAVLASASALVQALPAQPSNGTSAVAKRSGDPYPVTIAAYPAHNVGWCQSTNFMNACFSWNLLDGQCIEVPAAWNDDIQSFNGVNVNTICKVYADPYCSGDSLQIPVLGSYDVLGDGGFGQDAVTNIRCQYLYGATPAITVKAYVVRYQTQYQTTYQYAQDSTCMEVPRGAGFAGILTAFGPPAGVKCQLWAGFLCQGTTQTITANSNSIISGVKTFKCTTI